MKRTVPVLLCLTMLLTFLGCGGQTREESSAEPTKSVKQQLLEAAEAEMGIQAEDVEVSTPEWETVSTADGSFVYVLEQADFSKITLPEETHLNLQREHKDGAIRFYETDPTGAVVREMTVPLGEQESIYNYCFLNGDFWCIRERYTEDPETGERTYTPAGAALERWRDGEPDESFSLPELLGLPEEASTPGALTACPEGHMVMRNETDLYWLNGEGQVLGQCSLETNFSALHRDRDGALYISDQSIRSFPVQKLDCEHFCLSKPLFTCQYNDLVLPGSGPYDFFLQGETLRGVSFETGTVTELFSFDDLGISSTADVIYLDEDTLLLQSYGHFSRNNRYLTAKKTAPEEVPEKKTVTLAYGMDDGLLSDGFHWQDCSGQLEEAISDFSLTNGTYEVKVEEFSLDGGLNLMMAGGEVPDIICWDGDDTLLEPYIRQGYLTDLKPLMDADPETHSGELLPNILEGLMAADGGIYQIAERFMVNTLRGHQSMVGEEPGWSFQELYETVKKMPEDMVVLNGTDSSSFLTQMLTYTLSEFVDVASQTCDFGSDEFAALMYTARDYLPKTWEYEEDSETVEIDELSYLVSGDRLLQWAPFAGGVWYGAEYFPKYRQMGITDIGYPGVAGNGAVAQLDGSFSVCAFGKETEGAWAFLRNYLTYDYQKNAFGSQFPVRRDAFLASQKSQWTADYPDCTDEDFEAACGMVEKAVVPKVWSRTIVDIAVEEAAPFLTGEKPLEAVIPLIENRVGIYLAEQS